MTFNEGKPDNNEKKSKSSPDTFHRYHHTLYYTKIQTSPKSVRSRRHKENQRKSSSVSKRLEQGAGKLF
jgi:hypothetical protein